MDVKQVGTSANPRSQAPANPARSAGHKHPGGSQARSNPGQQPYRAVKPGTARQRRRALAVEAAASAASAFSGRRRALRHRQHLPDNQGRGSRWLAPLIVLSAACLASVIVGRSSGGRWPASQYASLLGSAGWSTRTHATSQSAASTAPAGSNVPSAPGSIQLAVVAPLRAASPFGASWRDVLEHTAQRLAWTDPAFHLTFHDSAALIAAADGTDPAASLASDLQHSVAAVAVGVADASQAASLAPLFARVPTALALGSHEQLQQAVRLGGREPGSSTSSRLGGLIQRLLPDKQATTDQQVLQTVSELYQRASSDDFLFIFLVVANSYIKEVPAVAMSFKQKNAGLRELQCMLGNCGGQIFRCVTDTSCKAALDCLGACEFNDQVCSYRCITSYESRLLEEFSLCIIQKHNCFGLSADIPMVPDPAPMASWRGQPLTHELAEDLFIGWLGPDPSTGLQPIRDTDPQLFSWRVFAGKNAAYDFFPCQYQLFYRGRGGMWYDPTFQVKTIDGRTVWRRRHYRVRRDKKPGTFRFSVLDNGVTSNEFWRILDCEEGLDWCVFYYSGAASRAGLSYSGAILASKSGQWPASQEARRRIEASLDAAGIKLWELSNVDNGGCAGAPLDPALMALA